MHFIDIYSYSNEQIYLCAEFVYLLFEATFIYFQLDHYRNTLDDSSALLLQSLENYIQALCKSVFSYTAT